VEGAEANPQARARTTLPPCPLQARLEGDEGRYDRIAKGRLVGREAAKGPQELSPREVPQSVADVFRSSDDHVVKLCWRPRYLHMSRQRSVNTARLASLTMAVLSTRP